MSVLTAPPRSPSGDVHCALPARLDGSTVADVRLTLHTALDSGPGDLVVDCSAVEVVDAVGLGVLVGRPPAGPRRRAPAGPGRPAAARAPAARRHPAAPGAAPRARRRPPGLSPAVTAQYDRGMDRRRTRDKPWVMRTYAGHSSAAASNALFRTQPGQGSDRPVGRVRPADADRLRRGRPAGPRRGRQGRRPGRPPGRHAAPCSTGIPLGEMNTSMTINATAMWLLALYEVVAEEQGVAGRPARRHHAERHHQGVPVPRDVRLPAGAVDAADHRHDHLHRDRGARAGTRSTSAATTCRRPVPRRCRSSRTRCAPRSPCSTPSATPARCRRSGSARSSRGSRSSSTPESASSRRWRRCGPSSSSGTRSRASGTA